MASETEAAPGQDGGAPLWWASRLGSLAKSSAAVGEAVMIRHSLFSIPFALAAVLLETQGKPPAAKLFWILAAAFGARNSANAINRLVDEAIDARNPRTASRPLNTGKVSRLQLWVFAVSMLALLVLGAAMLAPICLYLLPLAGFLVFGYSYTKRYTWLCHLWLGMTCSAAVMGAFLGISGSFAFRYFPLTGAVALWVCGFDIIYAIQDIEFDRAEGLKSVPARFGAHGARIIAALCHLGTLVGLASVPLFWSEARIGFWIGYGVLAVLLAAEHAVALGGTERHIRIAAYGINEVLPLAFLAGVALDLYLI
ncbi:MAG TPA: 4-hydroxybenzoate octaprenyltransferase [Rectinemataceae bacterium]